MMFSLLLVLLMMITRTSATVGIASTASASSTPSIPTLKSEPMDAANKRKRDDDSDDKNEAVPKLKTCSRCKTAQLISEYNKIAAARDGLSYHCKSCQKAKRPKCAECPKNPTFGLVMRKATHCKQHRKPAMIDVINPKCADCDKHPTFGIHMGKPIYCLDHKLPHMMNAVKRLVCEFEDCETMATYGVDKPVFCAKHKTTEMTDLKSRKCKQPNCGRLTLFGIPGEKAQWCSEHAQAGMIDVHHRRCAANNCSILACYGLPGHGRVACVKHKVPGMLYLKYTRCLQETCSNPCTHGVGFAMWCEVHALSTHQNLVERRCDSCNQVNILNTDNKCDGCGTGYSEAKKVSLRKQKEVIAFLDSEPELCDYELTDQRISVEQDVKCTTSHRPDVLWDLVTHIVILEVDESQHNAQNYQCETFRLRAIAECLMRPIIVVRFNPDAFRINGKPQKAGYVERYRELKKWILYAFEPQNVKGVIDVVYLYYNEFDAATAQTTTVLDKLE